MDNGSIPFRNHTALLLATALPYLQPDCRHPVELIVKFLEFSETIKLFREFHSIGRNPLSSLFPAGQPAKEEGIFGLISHLILDVEGMLGSLSRVCTGDEKELIGMFLNLIRAKNFYDNYGDLLKTMMSQNGDCSFPFGDFSSILSPQDAKTAPSPSQTAENPSGITPSLTPDLSALLNPEQQETLTLLKSLFADE